MGSISPIFDKLDDAATGSILALAHQTRKEPGECFFREGDRFEKFFVLTSGHVRLTKVTADGHEITLRLIGPGGPFGAIDGLGPPTHEITAEAVEHCEAFAWTSDAMRHVLEENGTLAMNTMRLMASRLRDLQQRYCQLMTEAVEQRVARAVLRLVALAGHDSESGIEVRFPVSRQDIAEMAGTSLFTVSRLLRGWEKRRILRGGRRHIILIDSQTLNAIAAGSTSS